MKVPFIQSTGPKQDHPEVHEGDFYFPDFPKPDSTVAQYTTDIDRPSIHPNGTVFSDGVEMTDGHKYAVIRGVPNDPKAEFALTMTTAWLTSPRGHNRRTVEHFMRLGIPIVSIGAEGSYRPKGKTNCADSLTLAGNVSQATSAHNFHEILDSSDELNKGLGFSFQNSVLLGESRGGMVGKGIIAFADDHDRQVIYSDLTAPCFPFRLRLQDIPESSAQLISEPLQLLRLMGSVTLRRLVHYPPTVDLHPDAVAMNIATIPTLLSGQAGDLAKHIPEGHNMHITAFNDDVVSNPRGWSTIYQNHPNVRIKLVDGAHLTIAHPSTLAYIESRIFSLIAEINANQSMNPDDLDFARVHLSDGDKLPIN